MNMTDTNCKYDLLFFFFKSRRGFNDVTIAMKQRRAYKSVNHYEVIMI